MLRAEQEQMMRIRQIVRPVPKQTAIAGGIAPTSVRWVDVNREGENKYNVRCRLVGKELKAKQVSAVVSRDGRSLRGRRTVGNRNVRHFSCSFHAKSRQIVAHRAS